MKKNKKIIQQNYKSILIAVALFASALAIRLLYMTTLKQILIYPDSVEYIDSAQKLMSFKLDVSRVPVYPLFILLSRSILPFLSSEVAVLMAQAFVSSITVVLMFYTSNILFGNYIKSFILVAFCAISICLINWDFLILTESITIFLVVILLFNFVLYIKNGTIKYALLAYGSSMLLVFTKPFYLALPMLIFFILTAYSIVKGCKKQIISIGVIALTIIYSSILLYSYINLNQNGYFGLSDVGAINSLGKVLQYKMYNLGDDKEIIQLIENELQKNDGKVFPKDFILKYKLDKNNYSRISAYTSKIISKHPWFYFRNTIDVIFLDILKKEAFTDYNIGNYKTKWPQTLFKSINYIPFVSTFGFLLALVLLDIVHIIYNIFRHQRYDWIWIFIIFIILYQFLMATVGAHGEYPRLVSPIYILMFMIVFKYIFAIFNYLNRLFKTLFNSNSIA